MGSGGAASDVRPNLDDWPYEHLVGLVTIGSSFLDHVLRMSLGIALQTDADPAWNRKTLSKGLRTRWSELAATGSLTVDELAAGTEWLDITVNLLDRRDHLVHALWEVDPSLPEGLRGTHVPTGRPVPDSKGLRRFLTEVRKHLADPRLRAISNAVNRQAGPAIRGRLCQACPAP